MEVQEYLEIAFDGPESECIHKPDAEFLVEVLYEEKPKRIVEIGGCCGSSSRIFASFIKEQGQGFLSTIEPYPQEAWVELMERHYLQDVCELIEVPSPWVNWPEDDQIDFLFIDGLHTFHQLIVDFYYWQRFVKMGGVIAMHDTKHNIKCHAAHEKILYLNMLEKIGESESEAGLPAYWKIRLLEEKDDWGGWG